MCVDGTGRSVANDEADSATHSFPVVRDDLPADEAALRTALDASSDRVIITKDEDDALMVAGWRDRAPDPANPWSRYRTIGLDRTSFEPLATSPPG